MNNLVDLHAHILPGLDDGPDNLTGSLYILEALGGLGYSHVFATPHHKLYSMDGISPEKVEAGVREVSRAAEGIGISIKILPGMEFDLDETIPESTVLVPGRAGHILVDAGFWGIPLHIEELLLKTMEMGSIVLLVHPERNKYLCRKKSTLSNLVTSGVRLLGNIGSFSGMYGRKVQHQARDLLKGGKYWAVASDMHSHDQLHWIKDGMDHLISLAGSLAAAELMSIRPMQLVQIMEGDH